MRILCDTCNEADSFQCEWLQFYQKDETAHAFFHGHTLLISDSKCE